MCDVILTLYRYVVCYALPSQIVLVKSSDPAAKHCQWYVDIVIWLIFVVKNFGGVAKKTKI